MYEDIYNEHLEYLKGITKNPKGVNQGYLAYNKYGEVTVRVGRTSNNPRWYRDFYKEHKRKPTVPELEELAHIHLKEGFWDEFGYIPPLYTNPPDTKTESQSLTNEIN